MRNWSPLSWSSSAHLPTRPSLQVGRRSGRSAHRVVRIAAGGPRCLYLGSGSGPLGPSMRATRDRRSSHQSGQFGRPAVTCGVGAPSSSQRPISSRPIAPNTTEVRLRRP